MNIKNNISSGHWDIRGLLCCCICILLSKSAVCQRELSFYEPEFDYEYCINLALYNNIVPEEIAPHSFSAFVDSSFKHSRRNHLEKITCNRDGDVTQKTLYQYNNNDGTLSYKTVSIGSTVKKCSYEHSQAVDNLKITCYGGNNINQEVSDIFFDGNNPKMIVKLHNQALADTISYNYNENSWLTSIDIHGHPKIIDYKLMAIEDLHTFIPPSKDVESIKITDNAKLYKISYDDSLEKYVLIDDLIIMDFFTHPKESYKYDFSCYLFDKKGLNQVYFKSNTLVLEPTSLASDILIGKKIKDKWQVDGNFYGRAYNTQIVKKGNSLRAEFGSHIVVYNQK